MTAWSEMPRLSTKLRSVHDGRVAFWCPGCEDHHVINITQPDGWGFNGNADSPTFTPSILLRSGHYAPGHQGGSCWCTYNRDHPKDPAPFKCRVCHSFVTDGQIQFLGDCTHNLVGQTVQLPDLPAGLD